MRTAARNRRPGQDPLSPRARALVRFFVAIPILTFLVASVFQLIKLARLINGDIGNIVSSVLHQTLGHEFKIGSINYSVPGTIRIDNVAVSSQPTWKASHGEAGLSVRQIVVKYDYNGLLSDPTSAAHYVQSITADHPTALVERLTAKAFGGAGRGGAGGGGRAGPGGAGGGGGRG